MFATEIDAMSCITPIIKVRVFPGHGKEIGEGSKTVIMWGEILR